MVESFVLRLGHRPKRDKRITTHVCLTARAFGCQKVFLSKPDSRVSKTVNEVVEKFGGEFSIENITSIESFVRKWPGIVVHLTMFGLPIDDFVEELKTVDSDILFVVGAEKVPPWVFEKADYNISIGNQPHSEVAALAVALNKVCGDTYSKDYDGALKVIPSGTHRQMIDNREFD